MDGFGLRLFECYERIFDGFSFGRFFFLFFWGLVFRSLVEVKVVCWCVLVFVDWLGRWGFDRLLIKLGLKG